MTELSLKTTETPFHLCEDRDVQTLTIDHKSKRRGWVYLCHESVSVSRNYLRLGVSRLVLVIVVFLRVKSLAPIRQTLAEADANSGIAFLLGA